MSFFAVISESPNMSVFFYRVEIMMIMTHLVRRGIHVKMCDQIAHLHVYSSSDKMGLLVTSNKSTLTPIPGPG